MKSAKIQVPTSTSAPTEHLELAGIEKISQNEDPVQRIKKRQHITIWNRRSAFVSIITTISVIILIIFEVSSKTNNTNVIRRSLLETLYAVAIDSGSADTAAVQSYSSPWQQIPQSSLRDSIMIRKVKQLFQEASIRSTMRRENVTQS